MENEFIIYSTLLESVVYNNVLCVSRHRLIFKIVISTKTYVLVECEAFTDAAPCLTLDCFLMHTLCIVVIVRMSLSQQVFFFWYVEYVKFLHHYSCFLFSVLR